jgi:anti-anti-sigma factor
VSNNLLRRPGLDAGPLLSVSTVTDPRPGRAVVEVVGEVDRETAPVLEVCVRSQASRPGVRDLVVDLAQVTFLDTAGVDVLVQAERRCRRRGVRLVVRTGRRRAALCPLRLAGFSGLVEPDERVAAPVAASRGHDVVAAARQ